MNLNKWIIIVLVMLCVSIHSYADNNGYLKIIFSSKDAVPAIQVNAARGQQTSPHYQLTFADSNLNKVFSNYTVLDFEKEYPIADSFPDDQTPAVRLRMVYKVIIDTTTGKSYDGLKKDIDTLQSYSIRATVRAYPAINLGTPPNDYNFVTPLGSNWPIPRQHLDLINALGAWDVTTGLQCVKIGIVDWTGFQHHEDLDSKAIVTTQPQLIASANNNYCHGNEVAGMAAAETNNNLGLSSLGYNVGLQYYVPSIFDPYIGILDAIHDKCKVVNCSWTTGSSSGSALPLMPTPEVQDILDLAILNNVTVVAAAGNNNTGNPDDYIYPASYNNVISVTSVGSQYPVGDVNYYNWIDCHRQWLDQNSSNYNNTHNHNNMVDICAPGYFVATTSNKGTSTNTVNGNVIGNGYTADGGTSFASPQVAATAALLYSVNPFFTTAQITKYLKDNAANIYTVYDNNTWTGKLGAGRLNAGASLQAAASKTYNGPAYCSGNAVNCPTQATSITTNATLNQSNYFYNKDITAGTSGSGYVQTNANAQIAFIATNSITLEAGFDANPSATPITQATAISPATYAYFTAYIEPCSTYVTGREAPLTKKALTTVNASKNLQLYPNPATNEVHIFFTIAKDETAIIKIANNTGIALKSKTVVSSKDGSGNTVFNIKDIPAGVYYITLTSAGNKMTKKLIKMKQ